MHIGGLPESDTQCRKVNVSPSLKGLFFPLTNTVSKRIQRKYPLGDCRENGRGEIGQKYGIQKVLNMAKLPCQTIRFFKSDSNSRCI